SVSCSNPGTTEPPAGTWCKFPSNSLTVKTGSMWPGIYTGAVTVQPTSGDAVTIEPGLYIFERGVAFNGSGGTIVGNNVCLYVGIPGTNTNAQSSLGGSASVT